MPRCSFLVATLATFLATGLGGCASSGIAETYTSETTSLVAAEETVLAPFTDHYSIRIEKPADVVWEHLKRLYVEGGRQREQGFVVTPLDGDLTAYLGGTRGVHPENTERPEVTIRVSALDEEARLLTLQIELENPVPVYVVHQVRPDGDKASLYQNIIMTKWPVTAPAGQKLTPEFVREQMLAAVAFHNSEVDTIMRREKDIIEALD